MQSMNSEILTKIASGSELYERDVQPWHRLSGESSEAYNAFCLYLNMGSERSLNGLIQASDLSFNEKQLAAWAITFMWTRRAELCEEYILRDLINNQADLSYSPEPHQEPSVSADTSFTITQLKRVDKYLTKGKSGHTTH